MRRSLNNRPLRSVLANRKMFQGGGIVASGGGPRPMANMQPSGILASSPNLIDSVVSDAINPQGGNTLSMAEGGIARFANGGYADMAERLRSDVAKTIAPLESYKEELVPSQTFDLAPATEELNTLGVLSQMFSSGDRAITPKSATMGSLQDESLPDAVNRIFPLNAFPGESDFEENFGSGELDRDKMSRFEEGLFDAASWFGETNREMSAKLSGSEVSDQLFDVDKKRATTAELRTINRMAQMRPDLASRIGEIGLSLINSKEPGQDYQITESLSLQPHQEALEDLSNNPLAQEITAQLKQEELATAEAFLQDSSPYQENLAEAARVRGEVEPFERAIGSMSAAEELQAGAAAADAEEMAYRAVSKRPDEPPAAAEQTAEPAADSESADQMIARIAGESPNEILPPSPPRPATRNQDDAVSAADQVQAEFREADTEEEQEAAQTSLESYIEKFKSAMPDYEGKTESEKGMDIVKMGMAIAAGESPNAITNISKGVMATIDNFTSDDKERRAYKRQVELSAAKYGLDSVSRDEAKADALAKELRGDKLFTVMKDSSIDGRKYDAGSLYRMSVGDMRDGKLAKLSGVLTTEGNYSRLLQHKVDMEKLIQNLGPQIVGSGDGAPTQNNLDTSLSDYRNLIKDSKNDVMMMTMLDSSIITNAQGKVTGVGSWFSRKVNSFANSLNLKSQLGALDKLAEEGLESKEYLYKQQVIANMMLKEILGEGSKNVSNIDRDLAQQIVGMLSEWDTIWADKDLLHEKLQHVRTITQSSLNTNLNGMSDLEFGWTNVVNRAGQGVSQRMEGARGEFAKEVGLLQEPSALRQAEEGIAPRPIVLNVWDFIDQDTGKIKKDRPRAS